MLKTEFLDRLKEKYPDNFSKYDYSLVPEEFRAKGKCKFICNVHGVFEQEPREHLRSRGCYKCSKSYKPTTKEFIINARNKHGTKYSYEKVVYVNNYTKVIITCPEHGDFVQIPVSHLSGNGCPKCGLEISTNFQRYNIEEFITKAKLAHGDRYDYSKVKYVNAFTKVIISCSTHGEFLQEASSHLRGTGCSRCKESFGERYIATVLDKLNVQYIREYKLANYNYRYDFYLPEYNIYIEYHGEQHYRSVDYFGGEKAFIKLKRRDKAKIELVKRSGGLLIVLNYKIDTLETIRTELVKIFNIIHPKFLDDRSFIKDYIRNSKAYLYDNDILRIRK